MGADLYRKTFENSTGYYRDSYNMYSVIRPLGLSWWRDVIPMLDKDGYLSVEREKELLGIVESAFESFVDDADTNQELKIYTKEYTKYIKKNIKELISFLKESIKRGEAIACSL